MPFPFAAAVGIGRAAVYVARYGRVALPYASQFGRGFGRGLVPVYGTATNLYISRKLGKLGVARMVGATAGDLTVGGMASSYVISKLRSTKPRRPVASQRKRTSSSRRYLYEF